MMGGFMWYSGMQSLEFGSHDILRTYDKVPETISTAPEVAFEIASNFLGGMSCWSNASDSQKTESRLRVLDVLNTPKIDPAEIHRKWVARLDFPQEAVSVPAIELTHERATVIWIYIAVVKGFEFQVKSRLAHKMGQINEAIGPVLVVVRKLRSKAPNIIDDEMVFRLSKEALTENGHCDHTDGELRAVLRMAGAIDEVLA